MNKVQKILFILILAGIAGILTSPFWKSEVSYLYAVFDFKNDQTLKIIPKVRELSQDSISLPKDITYGTLEFKIPWKEFTTEDREGTLIITSKIGSSSLVIFRDMNVAREVQALMGSNFFVSKIFYPDEAISNFELYKAVLNQDPQGLPFLVSKESNAKTSLMSVKRIFLSPTFNRVNEIETSIIHGFEFIGSSPALRRFSFFDPNDEMYTIGTKGIPRDEFDAIILSIHLK